MIPKGFITGLLALLLGATSFGTPFQEGNKALTEQRFEDAVHAFQEAASETPGVAAIYFNLATAQFRLGIFEEAMASYEYAATLTETDSLRCQSWYNIGNCMVKTGEALRETDPVAAAHYCRQAVGFYRSALEANPAFADAAYNLEITLRIAAHIEDEIRKQEEEEQQENELISYIRKKLQELIEQQTHLLTSATLGDAQQQLEQETRGLVRTIEESGLHQDSPLTDGMSLPGPLKETWEHTVKAADAMAAPDQPTALAELVAALGAAPEDPEQQEGESDEESDDYDEYDMEYEESDEDADMYEEADPFGDFSEYEEIRGVPPPNQTEMDILAEEVRNQERRKEKTAGEYKAVDKDW